MNSQSVPDAIIDPKTLADLYAMKLKGKCLEPEFEDGGYMMFDKTAPFEIGDFVILIFRPEVVPEGQAQCLVKRLVTTLPPGFTFPFTDHPESEVRQIVTVEQLNPPRRFAIPCDRLAAIHKCAGVYTPMSYADPEEPETLSAQLAAKPKRRKRRKAA